MDLSVVGLFMLVLVGHGVCLDDLCQEARCRKDGPAIRFPFKLKDGPSLDDQCGYPGFDLSCTNKKETLLQLPNSVKLYVKEIDYASQFIIARDPDECLPKLLRNFSLSGSPFESRYNGLSNYSFFNCTSRKGDGYDYRYLDCLSGPGYNIYAYASDNSISYTYLTNCTKLYNLSLVPSELFGQKSILLSWSMPGCQQCEQQGKFCKLKKNSTASLETECYDKPISKKGKGGVSTVLIIAIVIPVAVSLVLFYLGFCFLCRRAKSSKYSAQENDVANEITTVESLQFDLSSIEDATNHFSSDNKLGEGGFGVVYKGTLPNGQAIAVKRLSKGSEQGAAEFKNEVILVAKLQHRNLVRLLGFCLEGEEKILVYEYVPNKSLDYFLFDPEKQGLLDWSKRYRIIGGIARGILYLHEDSRLRVIHRDLKVSNILLDGDMNAKVSDFGMARIFGVDQTQGSTNRIVGTYGYMSPEYAMHGQFSVKSDAYSFGVLILEIISGKKNRSFNQTGGAADLVNYVWKHWRDGTCLEVMDPTLTDTYSRSEIIRCIHIGLLCVQEDPASRPTMTTIVLVLNSYLITLPSPHEPAFCIHSRTDQGSIPSNGFLADQSKSNFVPYSVDDGSITEVYPR